MMNREQASGSLSFIIHHSSFSTWIVIRRLIAARLPVAKDEGQQQPGDEAADVRHVSDAAALCRVRKAGRVLTDNLNYNPEAQHDNRRQFDEGNKESQK